MGADPEGGADQGRVRRRRVTAVAKPARVCLRFAQGSAPFVSSDLPDATQPACAFPSPAPFPIPAAACAKNRNSRCLSTPIRLSSPCAKNISLQFFRNMCFRRAIPSRCRGTYARSSRYVRRGCDGRECHVGRTWPARTRKSCGPGLPTLRPSLRMIPRATGARKPGSRGEHEGQR